MYGCSYDHGGDDCDCRGSANATERAKKLNECLHTSNQCIFMTSMCARNLLSAGDLKHFHLILLSF